MKHARHFFLALAALLCGLTASAHDFVVNGIYYNLPEDLDFADPVVEVTYMGTRSSDYINEYTGHVVIPSTVTYRGRTYRVASIGMYAFSGCYALESVVIPGTVEIIDDDAFSGCTGLKSITIPESVEKIGRYYGGVFKGCTSLTSVKCPARFEHLFPLADFSVRAGDFKFLDGVLVGYVGSSTNVVLPENFQGKKYAIGERAFKDSKITSITIPEGVTSIGDWAFDGTPWYNNHPDGVVYAGKVLYKYKGTMPANTSIEVKEGTVSISPSAFSGCSSLTSITIPESVTSIGKSAFLGCSKLTLVKCPVRFRSHFPKVDFSVRVGGFKFLDGVLVGYVGSSSNVVLPENFQGLEYSIGSNAFKNSAITSITIPASVTSIESNAFHGCTSLKEVIFEDGSKTLELGSWYNSLGVSRGLFYDCPLVNVYLGRNLSYYGRSIPFYSQTKLTTMTISEGVTSIEKDAFWNCSSLTSITIPESVRSIGENAFSDCIYNHRTTKTNQKYPSVNL